MNAQIAQLLKRAGLTQPKRREIHVEPKVLSEKDGIIRFTASDQTLDCYNEIVRADGWNFNLFAKNAPFVDSHRYGSISELLGKVIDWRVAGGALEEDVQFALTSEGNTFADWAFKMYRDGFLKACSVGFAPVRWASKWDADKSALLAQIAELKLDAETAAKLCCVYIKHEQIELSGCIIGANPNALAKSYQTIARAHKGGCLSDADVEKLSAVIADVKTVRSADDRADDERTRRRARLAILMEIQNQR